MRQRPAPAVGCRRRFPGRQAAKAFSLVEVVLALGVVSFGIVAVVSLLPIGFKSSADSQEESSAIDLLSQIISERMATPYTSVPADYPQLPTLTPTSTQLTGVFGISSLNQATTTLVGAHYQVYYSFALPPAGTLAPYIGNFRISWPGASANPTGSVEATATFAQP